jgi:hypothetical protein
MRSGTGAIDRAGDLDQTAGPEEVSAPVGHTYVQPPVAGLLTSVARNDLSSGPARVISAPR